MHVSAFGWDNRRLFHVACEVGVGTYGSKDVLYMLGSGLGNPVNALVGSARRTISRFKNLRFCISFEYI
jgi:hypothetical protein